MLHYMGPNFGPAPLAQSLPPVTPGTLPSAIPGSVLTPPPLPPQPMHAAHGKAGLTPALHDAIHAAVPHMMPPREPEAHEQQYQAVTQADGSILLHLKMADGKLGPAVKIVPAPKSGAPKV